MTAISSRLLSRIALLGTAVWLAFVVVGCEKDNADTGGGSNGNCLEAAYSIEIGMTAEQVVKIMGSPDSDKKSYDASERQMIWSCGTHTVLVDFQPGDSVFLVIGDDGVIKQGTWSAQEGYGK